VAPSVGCDERIISSWGGIGIICTVLRFFFPSVQQHAALVNVKLLL